MSRGFSRVVLLGNLGRDPELKYSQNGNAFANFSIAVGRRRRDQSGNFVDETDWYNVTVFGRQAETAAQYLTKGRQVLIDGRLQIRQYTGNDGVQRTAVDVIADGFTMVGPRDGQGAGGYQDQGGYQGGGYQGQGGYQNQGGYQQPAGGDQLDPFAPGPGAGGGQRQTNEPEFDDDLDDVPF